MADRIKRKIIHAHVSSELSADQMKKELRDNFAGKNKELKHPAGFQISDVKWNEADKVLTGTIYKLRHDNYPAQDHIEDLHIDSVPENIYLGDAASFSYSPDLELLLFEYNHFGARYPSFAALMNEYGLKVSAGQFVDKGQMKKLKECDLKKINLKIEKLGQRVPQKRDPAFEKFVAGADFFKSDYVDLIVQCQSGHIHKEYIQHIDKLLGYFGEHVIKAKVTAFDPMAEKTIVLNLLEKKRESEIELPLLGREVNHKICREYLSLAAQGRLLGVDVEPVAA